MLSNMLSKHGNSSDQVPNSGSFLGVQRGEAVKVGLSEPLPTSVDPSNVRLSASSSQSSVLQDPTSLGTDLDLFVEIWRAGTWIKVFWTKFREVNKLSVLFTALTSWRCLVWEEQGRPFANSLPGSTT